MRKGKDSRPGLPPPELISPYIVPYRGQADALNEERARLRAWRRRSGQLDRHLLLWLEILLVMLVAFGFYLSGALG